MHLIIFSFSLMPSISGMSTSKIRQRSSWPPNSQIPRSSWEHWKWSLIAVLRKIHTLPPQPDGLYKSNQYLDHSGTEKPHHLRKQNSLLFHFNSSRSFLFLGRTTANHTKVPDQGFQQAGQFSWFAQRIRVQDWDHHACRVFFSRWGHRQAWHWKHRQKFSTVSNYIFFYLNRGDNYIHRKIHKFYWYWSTRGCP